MRKNFIIIGICVFAISVIVPLVARYTKERQSPRPITTRQSEPISSTGLLSTIAPPTSGNDLIGRWHQIDGNMIVEFKSGGAFQMPGGGAITDGRYELLDGHRIRLWLLGLGADDVPITCDYSIVGNLLHFGDGMGDYQRVSTDTPLLQLTHAPDYRLFGGLGETKEAVIMRYGLGIPLNPSTFHKSADTGLLYFKDPIAISVWFRGDVAVHLTFKKPTGTLTNAEVKEILAANIGNTHAQWKKGESSVVDITQWFRNDSQASAALSVSDGTLWLMTSEY